MDDKNNLIQNEVMKVWSNGEQELFKLTLENDYEIICTETHKFFDEKNKENELNKFSTGDFIWIEHNNILIMEKIKKIEKYGKEITYDMEMKEPFRNYIANRFVVHNTGGANIKRWIGGGIGLSGVRVGW
jgi:intein/homing endonuclease